MIKCTKLATILFILFAGALQAQDIHWSQYNQSPLYLNPAATGNYDCDWRAGLNYRNQWSSVTTPYVTYSAFFDMPVLKNIGQGDKLGAGLLILNDVSGDAKLTNLTALISVAYHKTLGSSGNQFLSVGIQSGLYQKRLDFNQLFFGDQWDGHDFNSNIPSYEPFVDDNFSKLDLNAGLMYRGKFSKSLELEIGGAAFHLTAPTETFLVNGDNTLGMRIDGHFRLVWNVNKNIGIIPSALYQVQSGDREILAGADIGYFLNSATFPATFLIGGHYRIDDAFIASIGLDYQNFRFGASYDINTSTLKDASNGKGGLELSLIYTGCILPVIPDHYVMPCPRYF